MTPLATKLVFFTSSTLGALSLGTTAYLVKNPTAFAPTPTPVIRAEAAPLARPDPPPPVAIPEPIVLEPVTITGSRVPLIRTKAVPARRVEPPKPADLNPCSGWRDMGPTNIDKGDGTVRRVRTLC